MKKIKRKKKPRAFEGFNQSELGAYTVASLPVNVDLHTVYGILSNILSLPYEKTVFVSPIQILSSEYY